MKFLRTALALLVSASLGMPAQARMSFDANGSDRLTVPGLRKAPVFGAYSGVVQLQKWKDALAATQAGTKSARMLIWGGDDAVGNTTTTVNAQAGSWPQLLANAYAQQGYSVNTNSFFGNKNSLATNPYGASGSTYDPRLTMASVSLAGPSNAGFGNFPFNLTTSASAIAWTPSGQTDSTDIFYTKDGVTAAGFVNVDGGTNTAITRSGNGVGLGKITINYARGSGHVINAGWTSGTFQIVGMISYDSTVKDVQIVNLGVMAGSYAELARNASAYAAFSNINNLAVLGGDLMVLQQTQWDQTSSVPLNTVRANYGNMAAAGRDAGMDLLFITGTPWDTSLSNMAAATQQTYVDAWKTLAANLSAPVIDVYGYLGSYATQNAASRQANVRFRNTAGHAYDAAYIKAQLDNILTLPALSPPAPQTYDVSDVASLNALVPAPGSTVRLARGTTYAGPITLNWAGTADAPIVLTTAGTTASPAVITGTPSPSTVTPNYVDAITVNGSNIRIDGGAPIDGGKLGLVIKDSGRSSVLKSSGTFGLDVLRTEMSNVATAVLHNGRKGRYAGNYVHDLVILKNTNGAGNTFTASGEPNAAAWDDDDYGANPFIIQGSDAEMAWNRISRDIAPSFDYRTDGGALELFPPYGFIENISFHDNWVEGGDGVVEGGGPTGSGTGIRNVRVNGNIALNNFGFASLHNQGGSFEAAWEQIDFSYNTIVEENNTMSTRQTIILDGATKLGGFLSPQYGFNYNVIQINSGDAVFKVNNGTYHSNNVFNLQNNPTSSGAGGITHLYNDYGMTLATGEAFANPQFVNQSGRNFALQSGSPAAGKGHTAWTPVALLGVNSYPADYAAGNAKTFTQTTLSSSATTVASGTNFTLTATMAPTAATGTVTFYDRDTVLGTGTISNGTATFTGSITATGSHRVICTYPGDSTYAASISNALTLTIN